jgi:hypothetical protein
MLFVTLPFIGSIVTMSSFQIGDLKFQIPQTVIHQVHGANDITQSSNLFIHRNGTVTGFQSTTHTQMRTVKEKSLDPKNWPQATDVKSVLATIDIIPRHQHCAWMFDVAMDIMGVCTPAEFIEVMTKVNDKDRCDVLRDILSNYKRSFLKWTSNQWMTLLELIPLRYRFQSLQTISKEIPIAPITKSHVELLPVQFQNEGLDLVEQIEHMTESLNDYYYTRYAPSSSDNDTGSSRKRPRTESNEPSESRMDPTKSCLEQNEPTASHTEPTEKPTTAPFSSSSSSTTDNNNNDTK